jgi:hypothetical protein
MYVLAINHQIEDYDRWKAVFDEYPPSKLAFRTSGERLAPPLFGADDRLDRELFELACECA